MFKTIALMAMAALMGADAFMSPVATSFSGSAVATRVSEPTGMRLCYKIGVMNNNGVIFVNDVYTAVHAAVSAMGSAHDRNRGAGLR